MLIKLLTKFLVAVTIVTLRRMRKVVDLINRMEPEIQKLTDEQLQ